MGSVARAQRASARRAALWSLVGLAGLLGAASAAGAAMVAVGYDGTVLRSMDGQEWTLEAGATEASLFSVAGADAGWVAAGTAGHVVSSPDGQEWTKAPGATAQWLNAATRHGATWIAVGTGGAILHSADGQAWTPAASPTTADLLAVASDGATVLAVGTGGASVTSGDGVSWTLQPATGTTLHGVAVGPGGWVAVGTAGTVLRSDDGLAWTPATTVTDADLRAVAWGAGRFVAVGTAGAAIASPDGASWVPFATGTGQTLFGLGAPCQGTWVAVGDGGLVLTSQDGEDWTTAPAVTAQNLRAAACRVEPPAALACAGVSAGVGEPATLQAAGGTSPYGWQGAGAPATGSGPQFTTTFDTPGVHGVTLTDAGLPPYAPQSVDCLVHVDGPAGGGGSTSGEATGSSSEGSAPASAAPPLSCAAPAAAVMPGAPAGLVASGGKSPYTWQAPGGEVAAGAGGASSTTATFGAAGGYVVLVTDGAGQTASCGVSVVAPFVVGAGGPYKGSPGIAIHVAAAITGGVSGFTCAWSVDAGSAGGAVLGDAASCAATATFTDPGEGVVTVSVTDATGETRDATANVAVAVAAAPSSSAACPDCPTENGFANGHGMEPSACTDARAKGVCGEPLAAGLEPSPAPAVAASTPRAQTPDGAGPAAAAGLVATLIVAARIFLLRGGAAILLVILFSRLKRDGLLENPTRAFLLERIAAEPGTHFRELVRASGKGRGTIRHHLGVLVAAGLLQPVKVHGFTGYRLSDGPWTDQLPASRVLRSPLAHEILELVQREYCARVAELGARCGTSYAVAYYHARRLAQAGLIELVDVPGEERKARMKSEPPASASGAVV